MGVAARQLERDVLVILYDHGAKVLAKGHDGAGHQTVTFFYNGKQLTFHYPSSTKCNGHTKLNVLARLKRTIREIPAPADDVSKPLQEVETSAIPVHIVVSEITTAPSKRIHLSKNTRREIAKRYVSIRSLDKLSDETNLTVDRLIHVLLSYGGEPTRLVRIEQHSRRAAAAKRVREAFVRTVTVEKPSLPKPIPAKRGRGADNTKRNIQIARLVYERKIPPEDLAEHYGVTVPRIISIARDASPLLLRKRRAA